MPCLGHGRRLSGLSARRGSNQDRPGTGPAERLDCDRTEMPASTIRLAGASPRCVLSLSSWSCLEQALRLQPLVEALNPAVAGEALFAHTEAMPSLGIHV